MRNKRRTPFLTSMLILGYSFLYLPIMIMIVLSFNESRLVTLWSGFSFKWYKSLFHNSTILDASLVSLKIASISATIAVILGTMVAIVMVRFKSFRGRSLLGGMISAPLVMPDIITGLALLLLFIGMEQIIGWPSSRGVDTIIIAHITLTMAYVTTIVRARLAELDRSLEEAALDLGAKPSMVFFLITLPIIAPTLMSAWLLSLALSLDDLVIATFLSGPSSTTLPMVIFSSVRMGLSPEINALSAIVLGFLAICSIIGASIIHRKHIQK